MKITELRQKQILNITIVQKKLTEYTKPSNKKGSHNRIVFRNKFTFDLVLNNENKGISNCRTKQAYLKRPLRSAPEETENSFYYNWTMNNTRGSYCRPKFE